LDSRPLLSIIIPAYNEASPDRLPKSLEDITRFIATQNYPIEVVIVNNNSTDETLQIAEQAAAQYPYIRVTTERTQGKGAAVKTGMLLATGEYLFICDADLSMPIEEVVKFIPPQLSAFDVAIGSRELPDSKRIDEPELRHVIGRLFNLVVRVLAIHGLQDTQCGFKCFRREAALALFPRQTINGWAFDVEILFMAQRWGYQIKEVPITWIYKDRSKVRPLHDLSKVMREIYTIRLNALRGVYKP
jgi:glycosyltransferase involved in cell wall biosynthesis